MAASDAKLAESDAYLKKLHQRQGNMKKKENQERLKELERELELSQMSSWTGESVINITKGNKVERMRSSKTKIIDDLQSITMPDKETLYETIVNLRQ